MRVIESKIFQEWSVTRSVPEGRNRVQGDGMIGEKGMRSPRGRPVYLH